MNNAREDTYKIGIVCCEDLPKWGEEEGFFKLLENWFNQTGLSLNKTADHTSWPKIEWIPIFPISRDLPDEEELKDYDGFIMSGSHYSVNDDEVWIAKFQEWVKKIKTFQENNLDPPRIIAFCFSHQLVSKALGGKVGRNPSQKFTWKAEEVKINEKSKGHLFFKNNDHNGKPFFKLLQSHGESVLSLPNEAKTLASSSTCEHEIVSIGDHIITMQSHPEMPVPPMIDLILPSLKSKGLISDDDAESGMRSFEGDLDGDLMMRMIISFLTKCNV